MSLYSAIGGFGGPVCQFFSKSLLLVLDKGLKSGIVNDSRIGKFLEGGIFKVSSL